MSGSGNDAHTTVASETLTARVLHDRVGLLFGSYPMSLSMSFGVAVIFIALHAHHAPSPLHVPWLLLMSAFLLLRAHTAWRYRTASDPRTRTEHWLRQARIGITATGAVWGVGGVLFYTPQNEMLQIFTVLVLAGMSVGALNALRADFLAYRNYVLLVLVPLSVVAIAQNTPMQVAIGLLTLLLLAFLLKSGKNTAESISNWLNLNHTNKDLLDDLKQQKHQVLRQAEAMIGELVSSAPVALWVTNREGVVNFASTPTEPFNRLQHPELGSNLLYELRDVPHVHEQITAGLQGEPRVFELQEGEHCFEVHLSPMPEESDQQEGMIGVIIDISERKQHEQELLYRASFDQLTGLPNRGMAMREIELALIRAERNGSMVALFFLDLDNFKIVNDTMGHKAGDQLLQQTAERLRRVTRESDFTARISGDEFLVLAEGLQLAERAENIAYKITSSFRRPYLLDNREIHATASVGIAIFPRDGSTPGDLLQCADTAMYHAKEAGKTGYRFFTSAMQQEAERNHIIETELRQALRRGELKLHYQPKVDARTHVITGAEVLLRWESTKLGAVSPEEFIPLAELAGLMPEIGAWILHTACNEFSRWPSAASEKLHIAINISPQQFRKTDLLANVTEALVNFGLTADCLELEITESLLVQDAPSIMKVFDALNQMGVTLALDDFGTGYSSLSYLQKFPMQVLKIDKSFVQGLGHERDSESLVYAIIAMARSLNMQVVAEGVETLEQLGYLREHGVDLIQGYCFSKPLTADEFRRLLGDRQGVPLQPTDYSAQAGKPLLKSG